MTEASDESNKARPRDQAREARRAKALKANLRRRKAAATPPEKDD
jgi:hypothetical protein